ncbi:MAG: DUF309 domain-containing protein [Actinomycetota bacterium]
MNPEVSPYLVEGARLLAEGDYFMAHETLEEHWIDAPESERDLLQALIHVAVGLLHHEKGNLKGAGLQFRKARRRIEGYPQTHETVDLEAVRDFLAGAENNLDGGVTLTPPPVLKDR